jgi:hypothetical protein
MVSAVSSFARSFLGRAAAQPHQARGQDAAHLTEVRREVGIDRSGTLHPVTIRIASALGSAIV